MAFSPLGPLGFLNAKHRDAYLQLVENASSYQVCPGTWASFAQERTQKPKYSSGGGGSGSDDLPLHESMVAGSEIHEEES